MPLPSAQPRKAYDRTAYAALKSDADGAEHALVSTIPQSNIAAEAPDIYLQESEKLAQLRAALWQAFQSGPAVALPSALIDLTVAYTSALRLELNLLGYAKPLASEVGRRTMPAVLRKS